MVTTLVRIVFILLASIACFLSFQRGNDLGGVALLLLIIFVIVDYFRSGTVWVSFRYIRKGDFKSAEKHISEIKKPEWLRTAHRASYHTVLGYIALHKNELKIASQEFEESLDTGLKHTQDRLIAQINLATIYHRLKRPDSARKALAETKKYKVKGFEKELKELNKKIAG